MELQCIRDTIEAILLSFHYLVEIYMEGLGVIMICLASALALFYYRD